MASQRKLGDLVGLFFLECDLNGAPVENRRQGHVLAKIEPCWFLVKLFSWFSGLPWCLEVVRLEDMRRWKFFCLRQEGDQWMRILKARGLLSPGGAA